MSQAIPHFPEEAAEQATVFTNRGKLILALIVIAAAAGYFGFMAFKSATVYYYTVTEVNETGASFGDSIVRVSGKLEPGSFVRLQDSTTAQFRLTDGEQTLLASHDGVVPDLFFNEHSEIILEGTLTPDGVFASHNIIVKCPSKYVASG